MSIIYQPSGKALEYSPLACNLVIGCSHGCKYCYCPSIMHTSQNDWRQKVYLRKNIFEQLQKEAERMRGDKREILLSFMTDCYQSEQVAEYTRTALKIFEANKLNVQVLTKNGKLASRDFPTLKRNNWKFGSTIIFRSEKLRAEWEPGAPPIEERIAAVKEAHGMGIYTWVSMEPVVDPYESLSIIDELKDYVTFWKVGKINHYPIVEKRIDWKKFLENVELALDGKAFYIKKDLEKYRG